MPKTVYVGKENETCYLEITGTDQKGVRYRKRLNVEDKIRLYLEKEGREFLDARWHGNDLILYTKKETRFVVRNFEDLQYESLYTNFFEKIERAPIVSKNLQKGVRTSVPQRLGLKILYVNRAKLAALALTGTILVTGASISSRETVVEAYSEPEIAMSQVEEDVIAVPAFVMEEDSSLEPSTLESRLEETSQLQEGYGLYDHSVIMLGARVNESKIQDILESDRGKVIIDTANAYGIDPYLLVAKGLTESSLNHEACIPGGKNYNGYGVGAFQLENPDGRVVKAWNFETGMEDSLSITMDNAMDFNKNVQGAAMYFQNRLNLYHGNIYLALQSYNYGQGMMKIVIHDYAKQKGITEEEVINNLQDLGWLEIVRDVHENPNNYYYRVMLDLDETDQNKINEAKQNYVWKHEKYGNDHYVADVLSYYVGVKSQNRDRNGNNVVTNLSNHEVLVLSETNGMDEINKKTM